MHNQQRAQTTRLQPSGWSKRTRTSVFSGKSTVNGSGVHVPCTGFFVATTASGIAMAMPMRHANRHTYLLYAEGPRLWLPFSLPCSSGGRADIRLAVNTREGQRERERERQRQRQRIQSPREENNAGMVVYIRARPGSERLARMRAIRRASKRESD